MVYDVIILGGGSAGLTAAIYTCRSQFSTLVIDKSFSGGQIASTDMVFNYPGFPEGISGVTLALNIETQARNLGAKFKNNVDIRKVDLKGDIKKIYTDSETFEAKNVIIATGASYRRLGVEGEEEKIGRGVAFCATCDGALFKDKEVAVIGGGDTAITEASFLTRFAKRVYLIHRRDSFRASIGMQMLIKYNKKIETIYDSVVDSINGNEFVESITVRNVKTNEETILPVSGVFLAVGFIPSTELFKDQVSLDDKGYIIAGDDTKTSIEGVFAAGDVRTKQVRQVITAAGDGATAAVMMERRALENNE